MLAKRKANGFLFAILIILASSAFAKTSILNSWVPYQSNFSRQSLVYEKNVPIVRSFLTPGRMVAISDDVYIDGGKKMLLAKGTRLFEVSVDSQAAYCTLEGVRDWTKATDDSRRVRLCFQRSGNNSVFQAVYRTKYRNFGIPVITKLNDKDRYTINNVSFKIDRSIDESQKYEIIIRYGYIGRYNKSAIIIILKDGKSEFKLEENHPLFKGSEGQVVDIAGAKILVESWDGLKLGAKVISGFPDEPIEINNPI